MTAYADLVNIEALTLEVLRDAGMTVYTERIGSGVPFVLVTAAGGPPLRSDNPGTVQVADVQIDTWAATKSDALALMQQASAALRTSVRTDPNKTAGTLIRALVPAPNYVPDDDVLVDGNPAPRYLAVATITARP